jgi:hypothetical protein
MKVDRSVDTQLTLRLLARIQLHRIEDPIAGRVLAEEFGIDIRRVQMVVEELRDARYKIGSSMDGSKPGYFLARNADELYETAEHYRSRARAFLGRANRLMDFGSMQPTLYEQPVTEANI